MARTLVRQFLHDVASMLQDNPQFGRWPERELVTYTNYGQLALATYLPLVGARTDVIQLVAGTRQDLVAVPEARIKPGDGSDPADAYGISLIGVTRNMGTDGETPGRAVRGPVDRYALDAGDPDWHLAAKASAVMREFVHDKNLPLVFYANPPVPAVSPQWVEVQWNAEPPRVPDGGAPGSEIYAYTGDSTATLGVREQFVELLQHYVVAMALLKGSKNVQNLPKAQVHTGIFVAGINAMATAQTGVNPNLRALPFVSQIAEAR